MANGKKFVAWLLLSDLIMFNLAFYASYLLRSSLKIVGLMEVPPISTYFSLLIFGNFIFLAVFLFSNLYREKRARFDVEEFWRVFTSLLLCFLIVTGATFLYKSTDYSRSIITVGIILSLLLISASRYSARRAMAGLRAGGYDNKNVAIFGAGERAKSLEGKIKSNSGMGYNLVGIVEKWDKKELEKFIQRMNVKILFIASPIAHQQILELSESCKSIEIRIIPDYVELIAEPLDFSDISDIPMMKLRPLLRNNYKKAKRFIDVLASAFLMIIASPIMLLAAVLIKLTSPGDVIFKQTRIGKKGAPFAFYKFRSMRKGSEKSISELRKESREIFHPKLSDDKRVTFVGKILRRTCIDELPQLWNVFRGDMSLVGPRPCRPGEEDVLGKLKEERQSVKPGMTGLWQVSGRHEIMWQKGLALDLYYVRHMSLILDLKILLLTIPAIIISKGKW